MSVKIILLALETLLLFLFLVPLPVICSGNLLGIIVSVMLMKLDKILRYYIKNMGTWRR